MRMPAWSTRDWQYKGFAGEIQIGKMESLGVRLEFPILSMNQALEQHYCMALDV